MPARQPAPTLWLMTDERADAGLEDALKRLPRGAGVIFRHYGLPPAARRRRFDQVRRITRARGLILILAGDLRDAVGWRADGWHSRSPHRLPHRLRLRTAPVHNLRERIAAHRAGADLVLISPAFPTRSHPGAPVLGPVRFGGIAARSPVPVIALGGMNASRYRQVALLGAVGWAAIDAWSAA